MPQPSLDATDVTKLRAVRIPTRLDNELRRRAAAEERSISEVLRAAISRYLERTPPAA